MEWLTLLTIKKQRDIIDFYKFQIEQSDKHYDGMRTLLWQRMLQVYAGYTAIAVVFHSLDEKYHHPHSWQLGMLAIMPTVILYLCAAYSGFQVVLRLRYYGELSKEYLKEISGRLGLGAPQAPPLKHQYFWVYTIQQILNTVIVLGLLDYEVYLETPVDPTLLVIMTILVFVGIACVFYFVYLRFWRTAKNG